ncbi:LANO_0F16182g1_1 [Lachancea nothofagi CBS 11611]|uniref:LANO_0F16182g1_1 n=1 Tax=Lachancea nothofagi CBS 11611 TaxID=1266666 RepID=A0A1G4KD44_9SACH|nr:LANO_0F16182g1_1 [Lachancea nothofagi CBS 11611]
MEGITGSHGRRNSIIGSIMARKYENKASAKSEPKTVTNRDLIHGVASSFLEAAYQRLRASKASDAVTIDDDYDQFVQSNASDSSDGFWKDENFRQEYETMSETEGPQQPSEPIQTNSPNEGRRGNTAQEHFVDILLNKMISAILPENFPEREHFTQRVNDPLRKKRQKLSATILANNLKVLTTKLGAIFEFQDSVIRLIAWRNPSGTITLLILVTMICFNPMFLAIIPMLYILYGIMVPGYTHRHPPNRTAYLSRRTYGKSLVISLTSGGKKASWHPSDDIQEYDYNLDLDPHDIQRAHHIKQSMEFVVNLRDLQNSMSTMVSLSKGMEKFVFGTAGFKDEHRSTALFLAGLGALLLSWLVSPFVNWSLVSAVGAWSTMIAIHPEVRSRLARIIKQEQVERGREALKRSERYDIVLDEAPEVRSIEVFEIYKQGLVPKDWTFLKFSTSVFDPQDSFRKAQIPPPGVETLAQVQPPVTWAFDNNSDWEIDVRANEWARDRGLQLRLEDEFLVDDSFKRRRLTRTVLRYATPARKPSYK